MGQTYSKDARKIIARAKRAGYSEVTGRRHPRLVAPDGGRTIVLSSSASDTNASRNIERDILNDFKRIGIIQ